MHGPRKPLSEEDQAIWARYTAQSRPLKGHQFRSLSAAPQTRPSPVEASALTQRSRATRVLAATTSVGWLVIGSPPSGLDKSTWQRFRAGRLPMTRRIDLHGLNVQQAFDRFKDILAQAAAQGLRCIEIITGRGSGDAGGALRRELPLWLNLPHLRPLVLAATHPHDANNGAVWLLLKRPTRSRSS